MRSAKPLRSISARTASPSPTTTAPADEAIAEVDVRVMFLIDRSGSMQGAIEQSKEALSRILAGFPADKVHIVSFDTVGTVHVPKAASRPAVQHMLAGVTAGGGAAGSGVAGGGATSKR